MSRGDAVVRGSQTETASGSEKVEASGDRLQLVECQELKVSGGCVAVAGASWRALEGWLVGWLGSVR